MSRAVRRLVVDYQPLWILMDLILFAIMVMMDWGWLFNGRSTQMVQWFVPVFSVFTGLLYGTKLPAWQALPIFPGERRRALWWIWMGLPLIRVMLCMALALPVLSLFHGVHATPPQIATLVEVQLLAVLPMGAVFAANGLLRRRFGVGSGVALVAPMFVMAAIVPPVALGGGAQLAGVGALILAVAAASYAGADRIGRLADRVFGEGGGAGAGPTAAGGRGARGWAAMAPYALSALVLAAAAAVAINYSLMRLIGPNLGDKTARLLPSQMLMSAILLTAIGGQAAPYALRALRALPIGSIGLTAVLQGFMLAVVLFSIALLWAVMRGAGWDTSQIPVYLSATIPAAALRLPLNFRVGLQAGSIVAVAPLLGLVLLPMAPWAHSLWFTAAMGLVAVATWVWTWWELACGRGAYRPPPLGVARWRGGLN